VNESLRFGVFIPPHHSPYGDPTLDIHRDLALVAHLERLDFDEAWFGEHHSGGTEIFSSPELMIATAAAQTQRIRLGTGVVSIPYHHPFLVADRINLLDHLTRGRTIFGVGPGALPSDAWMLGLDPKRLRPMLREGLDAVVRLLTSDEPVSVETDWFTLRDARLQLRPYSRPSVELAVASLVSPVGAQLAGRYGAGLLSVGATSDEGAAALVGNWTIAEEAAAAAGTTVSRADWRIVGIMHLADTRAQAVEDLRYGLDHFVEYFQKTAAFPQFELLGDSFEERLAFIDGVGVGAVGTVEDAIAQIERVRERSGGFGTYLLQAHNMANPAATWHSYDLFARYVIPHFKGAVSARLASEAFTRTVRPEMFARQRDAIVAETERYRAEATPDG
jgi:alkanesulfonate monooxygenase SsuD/methylene tetrahydromethanopterin reductase-like flavin-dependent oxidoreductase (luciferase family)